VHPDDKIRMQSKFQQFIAGESDDYSIEFRLKRKNGGFSWIASNGLISRYDENGKAEIVIGIHQDITDRKNVEDKNKEKEKLLKKGEELAQMGSWEWDVKSGIVFCSDQWQRIHGTHKSEYKKDELMSIAHPDDRAKVNAAFDKTLRKHVPYDIEHRIIRQNDRKIRLIKAYGEIIEDHSGDGSKIKGYARDISEEKRAEEKFREKFEELQRWKKLTIGRELKMSMLKEKNRRLEKELQKLDGERKS
jgi:PAS domain S-box-containing protein